MKTAYILHGTCDKAEYMDRQYPSLSNSHWLPWIQKELLAKGWLCQTPEMPTPYAANYEAWKKCFSSYPISKDTLLVGHSAGCGFFLKFLAETKQVIDHLVLVAPWVDPDRRRGAFLEFILDKNLPDYVGQIDVFNSTDDKPDIQVSTKRILEAYPETHYHEFTNRRHFCLRHMGTVEFPELLQAIEARVQKA